MVYFPISIDPINFNLGNLKICSSIKITRSTVRAWIRKRTRILIAIISNVKIMTTSKSGEIIGVAY